MELYFNLWPQGKSRCITMSYDDGVIEDRRLVDIFNRYGIRGAFHLNTACLGDDNHIQLNELCELYKGHEISAHTHTHPYMCDIPSTGCVYEILENRRILENATNTICRSLSYPYGQFGDSVTGLLSSCGIEYSRTTVSTKQFLVPQNFLLWHPTCHHNEIGDLGDVFFGSNAPQKRLSLFYVWGHSYEFERAGNWRLIEDFCQKVGNRNNVWYATGIEIKDYVTAIRSIKTGADGRTFYNASHIDIWLSVDGEAVCIKAGETVKL